MTDRHRPPSEIPDLIVEPVSRERSPVRERTAEPPLELELTTSTDRGRTEALEPIGRPDEIDLLDEGVSAGLLELELADGFSSRSAASAPSVSASEFAAPAEAWPTGITPPRDELLLDEEIVRRMAGFGAAPSSWWLTPRYAARVWARRRALRVEGAKAELALRDAETARDDELVRLAEAVRPQLEKNDRFRDLLKELSDHESLIEERQAALEEMSAHFELTAAELEARQHTLESERTLAEQACSNLRAVVERLTMEVGRLEGRRKRVDIERRALLDVVRRRGEQQAEGELPEQMQSSFADLKRRELAVAAELEPLQTELAQATKDLRGAESGLEQAELALRRFHSQRTTQIAERSAEVERRRRPLEQARSERRRALVRLARVVLALRGDVPVDPEALARVRRLDAEVQRCVYDAQRLRLAPLACDEGAVRRGLWIAAASMLVLVALIAFMVASGN